MECPVCMDRSVVRSDAWACAHAVCAPCTEAMRSRGMACPLCRSPLLAQVRPSGSGGYAVLFTMRL